MEPSVSGTTAMERCCIILFFHYTNLFSSNSAPSSARNFMELGRSFIRLSWLWIFLFATAREDLPFWISRRITTDDINQNSFVYSVSNDDYSLCNIILGNINVGRWIRAFQSCSTLPSSTANATASLENSNMCSKLNSSEISMRLRKVNQANKWKSVDLDPLICRMNVPVGILKCTLCDRRISEMKSLMEN